MGWILLVIVAIGYYWWVSKKPVEPCFYKASDYDGIYSWDPALAQDYADRANEFNGFDIKQLKQDELDALHKQIEVLLREYDDANKKNS